MQRLSRRTFLKGACATAAALALPETGLSPWEATARADVNPSQFPAPEVMNRVVARALARGGYHADLCLETRTSTHIVLAESRPEAIEYGVLRGGGARTLSGEKYGYAFAESHAEEDLLEAAATAAEIAAGEGGTRAQAVRTFPFEHHITCEQPIAGTSVAGKIALLERTDQAARAVDPSIQHVRVDYEDARQLFAIATASGELVYDDLPVIYYRVTVTAQRNGQRAEGMYRASQRAGLEFLAGDFPERAGRAAGEQAVRMLDARPAPSGEMPVVIAAGGGVMFHEAVGHGLEADAVLRGASVFAGRVGEQVASELVNLYDDASVPNARGSFNVDDEATAAAKTQLIARGRLVGYMQDRRSAHLMQARATANGRRQSFRYPPLVRMTNTYVAPGEASPEEIIRETRHGLYAVHFGGGEVDPGSGQFTFGLREAYLIEDGRVTAPVRGANLVGAGIQVLERIDRVGSDYGTWPGTCGKGGQWVPVTSGCPTLRVTGITVGGTA